MKVEHLVVDTNAFVKNLPLHELGENIYTTHEVVAEIRDSATKQRLEVLPYELNYKQPFPEYIQLVTKLSKATGDYASLSAVDIQLIALAYQLTKELCGPDVPLKTEIEPIRKVTVVGAGPTPNSSDIPVTEEKIEIPSVTSAETENSKVAKNTDDVENVSDNESESSEDDDEDTSDEEGGEWITPSNYKQKIAQFRSEGGESPLGEADRKVACLTSDFSMQNVMLHVGLKVISPSGGLIRTLRTYILRCHACFTTTSRNELVFCPKCGHKTLKKVAVSVNPEDGSQIIHLSRRKKLSGRGKRFSLPTPQGGKHARNPILCADQPVPQQRPSKQALIRNNPMGFEYVTGNSPFVTKDLYSRAAMLGINYGGKNYWERKNPNEAKKTTGKKKNRKPV